MLFDFEKFQRVCSHNWHTVLPSSISLLAKIWSLETLLLLCFFVCFVCVFAVYLLLFVLFVCVPRFLCLSPLCCATCAVVCVTFSPSVRLYLVFLLPCVVSAWCFFGGSCVFFCLFSVAAALWFGSPLVFRGVVWWWLVSLCVGRFVRVWLLVCVLLVCWLLCCWCSVSCLVSVLCCSVRCSVVLWSAVLLLVCFAPPGCLVARVFCCWCVSPAWFMLLLVAGAFVLLLVLLVLLVVVGLVVLLLRCFMILVVLLLVLF